MADLQPGDTLVVWRLIELFKDHQEGNIEFVTEQIDTPMPGGKLIFHRMGTLAEFERDLFREHTNVGPTRARGRVGG